MIFLVLCVQVVLLNLAGVTIANINYHASQNSSSKFAVLLKDLIQINEQRFETLKKLTKLQEHTIKHGLRTKPELALGEKDAQKRNFIVIFLGKRNPMKRDQVLMNNPITLYARTIQAASSEETADSGSFEAKNGSALFYRQGMTARYKYCKDACLSTLEDVCMDYSCSSRLKKRFRKGCKSRCKEAVQI